MDLPERSSSLMMACLMCHGKNPIGEAGLLQISVLGCLLLPIDSVGGEDTVSNLYQGASLAREYQFFMMNHPDVYHLQHVCVRLVSLVSLVYWRILFLFLAHQYAPGDPLAVALGDDLKLESLLRLLENELPKTGRVLLGATAGVRQAMQDNTDMFSSLKVSL